MADNQFTAELLVQGMNCGHCVASVTEEVLEIPGVDKVDVDLNSGSVSKVTVRSARPIDDDAIQDAIAEAGFELQSINRVV